MGNDDQEEFVRQKVRVMLNKLLIADDGSVNSGMRNEFFCKCKAFHLYDVVIAGMNF
jgi:hypothetical protein